ncbi:MAG TPA: hypothetical protein VHN78_15230 [Chloroflexota bacterium]|nr:hypothetical protein [Chloroflexota bacterium]
MMTESFRPLGGSEHEHEALWPLLYEMGHGTLPPEGLGLLPPDVAERIARLCRSPEPFSDLEQHPYFDHTIR